MTLTQVELQVRLHLSPPAIYPHLGLLESITMAW